MTEDIDFLLDSTKENMESAIAHLERALLNIRAGKASPAMLGSVTVDYYGSQTPLSQVANISTPDARTLTVQPWEKGLIGEIEKGIMIANIGLNPMNNGESVILNIPALTEERRRELAKKGKSEGEDSKIGVRNDRKTAMNDLKKLEISEDLQKRVEADIQTLTDKYIAKIDEMIAIKEKEIMTV
ncbi:MAG: ribosome recycling factor [Nonlabens sp.]|nr:ribosome recycling factor [Nonlabens sp.]MDP5101382.1 ribosome recycling factor [Nonlabens sp.]